MSALYVTTQGAEDSLRVCRLCAACLRRVDAYGRTIGDGTEDNVLVI